MKGILKNNKGITMLPLIITIVVLLILASVTIKEVKAKNMVRIILYFFIIKKNV